MNDVYLLQKAQSGDQEAMSEIFNRYKGFIITTSKSFFLNGADKDDIHQEGMIGLLKAIRGYNSEKNASFTTFASLCIRRQLITAIKKSNSDKNKALNRAVNDLYPGENSSVLCGEKTLSLYTPEEIFLGKEKMKNLKGHLISSLSKMEKEVFYLMIDGNDYIKIAEKTGRNLKSVDNAIQRIKKKSKEFLDE